MGKKIVSFSGGAIKINALIESLNELLLSGVRPDLMAGVSSGSLVTLSYVTGNLSDVTEFIKRNLGLRVIFSKWNSPVTPECKPNLLSIVPKLIQGKSYIGKMDNLEKNIKKLISKESFDNYVKSKDAIDAYVVATNARTRRLKYWNLKDLSYEKAVKVVIASSSIATQTNPIEIDGEIYLDGGHKSHNAASYIIKEKKINNIDELISVYSIDEPNLFLGEEKKYNSITNAFEFLFDCGFEETTISDQLQEQDLSQDIGFDYYPIYIKKFNDSAYTITDEARKQGFIEGRNAVKKWYLEKK